MLPPFLAFAWLLWRQCGGVFLVLLAIFSIASLGAAVMPDYFSADFARCVIGLLVFFTLWFPGTFLLLIFTYGAGSDIIARESCFPAGLLRLPAPTRSLAVWPMAYGAVLAVVLWLVNAWFILGPWLAVLHETLPGWWPATLMTTALAWLQAILWLPFGLRGFRLVLLVVLFLGVVPLAVIAGRSNVAEGWFVALFASLTMVAWALGYVGVLRARRGDVPNWDWMFRPLRQLTHRPTRRRAPFISAAWAQVWFECRRTGSTLPILILLGLPVALWTLLLDDKNSIPVHQTPWLVALGARAFVPIGPLLIALAVPVFAAGIGGGWLGSGKNLWVKDQTGMMPFLATLPMSTADMIGAVVKTAAWSTLAAWTIFIVIVPLAVVLTGHLDNVIDLCQPALQRNHPLEIQARIVIVAAFLLVWTWKRKVDRLCIGLTGRKWIEVSLGWGRVPVFLGVSSCVDWLIQARDREKFEALLEVLPWFLALLVLCRFLAAAWALRHAVHQGLLQPKTAACWVACWILVTSALFGGLAWARPIEHLPIHYLAFVVLFAMPMVRLAAAPLALAWNRHR